MLQKIRIEGERIVFQSPQMFVKDPHIFDSLRTFLEPHRAITQEELTEAKNEAKRLEHAITILKVQIQNHPMSKTSAPVLESTVPRHVASAEKLRLEAESIRLDHEIKKFASVTKAILDDLAEIFGTSGESILKSLNASRSLHQILL